MQETRGKRSQQSIRAEGIVPVFVNSFELLDGAASIRINFGVAEDSSSDEGYFLCTAAVGMSTQIARRLHEVLGDALGLEEKKDIIQ